MRRKSTKKPRRRNPVAASNALLRKGGAHGKTRKAERKAAKQTLHNRSDET